MENTAMSDLLYSSILPLIGGILITLLLSWLFVRKYIAKKIKDEQRVKQLSKMHYWLGVCSLFAAGIICIISGILLPGDSAVYFSDLLPFSMLPSFFFFFNYFMIKRYILKIDRFGDKIGT